MAQSIDALARDANAALTNNDLPRARRALAKLAKLTRKDFQAWFLLGAVCGALGDNRAAVEASGKAVQIRPSDPSAQFNLGNALQALGRHQEAVACFRRVNKLDPRRVDARVLLGNSLDDLGESDAAVRSYREALEIQPQLLEAHANLAKVLAGLGQEAKAIEHYTRAVAIDPTNQDVIYGLVSLLASFGDLTAIENVRNRISPLPGSLIDAVLKSILADKQGDGVAALAELDAQLTTHPDSLLLTLQHASVCHHGAEADCRHARRRLQRALTSGALTHDQRVHVEHALAEVADRLGDYVDAFAHVRSYHELKLSAMPKSAYYQAHGFENLVARLIQEFPHEPTDISDAIDLPVFIVGMPRSGTSLVEQIMAMHPQVFGAGERRDVEAMVQQLMLEVGGVNHYPEAWSKVSAEALGDVRTAYLEMLARLGGEVSRITDKLPHNFLFLGVLSKILPGVRVIHCRRGALDTCISIYMREFGHGHAYAHRLDWLAHYYTQYERLMAHFSALPGLRLIDVWYEDVVLDLEAQARRLIEFVELPWDPVVLQFHRSGRIVNTASYDQVRRPIYVSSVGRWRRYREGIEPLIEVLGER